MCSESPAKSPRHTGNGTKHFPKQYQDDRIPRLPKDERAQEKLNEILGKQNCLSHVPVGRDRRVIPINPFLFTPSIAALLTASSTQSYNIGFARSSVLNFGWISRQENTTLFPVSRVWLTDRSLLHPA